MTKLPRFFWFVLAVLGIVLTRLHSFLLFHSLIEMVNVAILAGVFILAWNTRDVQKNTYVLFLGIMSVSVAGLTLVHTLAYRGMGVFPDHDANLPTQLWVASRYVLALALLMAPLGKRNLNPNACFAGVTVLTLVVIGLIFAGAFPDCFVEGSGLTPFKRISEVVIGSIMLASIGLLHRKRATFDPGVHRLLVSATVLMALTGLPFSLYEDVDDLANMSGHLLNLAGFYLLYIALVQTGLARPFTLLFRDVRLRTEELETAHDRLEILLAQTSQAETALRRSEQQVRRKLDALLLPEGNLEALELADIIDVPGLQALMDKFHALTQFGVGIIDRRGRVLVATGWQDICTQFHRACPASAARCRESDIALSEGVGQGEFKSYRCPNGMWDIATPIIVGNHYVGNLFLGQFLYTDEVVNEAVFRAQARVFGFDEQAYLDALARVPRWTYEEVEAAMQFYATFTQQFSTLSYANLRLAHTLAERDDLLDSLQESLDEKTVLLREVYHRVKNNLSTIISLLMLQQGTIRDSATIEQFQELEGRVRSISMVHDLLYHTELLSRVRFEAYLQAVVVWIQDTFDETGEIELSVTAPDMPLVLDAAVPCGLIVNELLTNAFKYAFPPTRRRNGGPPCRIAVHADYDGELLTLSVSDNGIGLPAPVLAAWTAKSDMPGSLGLRLVRLLGENQLRGRLEIEHGEGTTFRLRFDPRRFDP